MGYKEYLGEVKGISVKNIKLIWKSFDFLKLQKSKVLEKRMQIIE